VESNGAGGSGQNGSANGSPSPEVEPPDRRSEPPPGQVRELADACVRFVERSVGVKLDYEPETLSILDHYLAGARAHLAGTSPAASAEAVPAEAVPAEAMLAEAVLAEPHAGPGPGRSTRAETGALVAAAAGAYFGEVVRRRHPSWWRVEGDDPAAWRIELEPVFLSFSPVEIVSDALAREGSIETSAWMELEEEDQQAVAARLADLPPVDDAAYHAPTTWLEVIDIAVDAIRAHRLGKGEEAGAALGPEDYEPSAS
jgi:hypothetical protein